MAVWLYIWLYNYDYKQCRAVPSRHKVVMIYLAVCGQTKRCIRQNVGEYKIRSTSEWIAGWWFQPSEKYESQFG